MCAKRENSGVLSRSSSAGRTRAAANLATFHNRYENVQIVIRSRWMRGPSPWVIKHSCTRPGTFPRKTGDAPFHFSTPRDPTYRGSTIRNRLFTVKKGGQIFAPSLSLSLSLSPFLERMIVLRCDKSSAASVRRSTRETD